MGRYILQSDTGDHSCPTALTTRQPKHRCVPFLPNVAQSQGSSVALHFDGASVALADEPLAAPEETQQQVLPGVARGYQGLPGVGEEQHQRDKLLKPGLQ